MEEKKNQNRLENTTSNIFFFKNQLYNNLQITGTFFFFPSYFSNAINKTKKKNILLN